jgi:hypothetical protein
VSFTVGQEELMNIDIDIVGKILAPTITGIIGFITKRYFDARPKLITYLVHASAIPLGDDKKTNVNTHSIVVRNAGKKTAHNVRRVTISFPPFKSTLNLHMRSLRVQIIRLK